MQQSSFVGVTFRLTRDVLVYLSDGVEERVRVKNGPERMVRVGTPRFPHQMLAHHANPHGGYDSLSAGIVLEVVGVERDSDGSRVLLIVHGHDELLVSACARVINRVLHLFPHGASDVTGWSELVMKPSQWNRARFDAIERAAQRAFEQEQSLRKKAGAPLLPLDSLPRLHRLVARPNE